RYCRNGIYLFPYFSRKNASTVAIIFPFGVPTASLGPRSNMPHTKNGFSNISVAAEYQFKTSCTVWVPLLISASLFIPCPNITQWLRMELIPLSEYTRSTSPATLVLGVPSTAVNPEPVKVPLIPSPLGSTTRAATVLRPDVLLNGLTSIYDKVLVVPPTRVPA